MRARRERSVSHSLSCTALEWERIRELAEAAGQPMSRYIVARALSEREESGERPARGGEALALDAREQRALHDAVRRAEALIGRLVGGHAAGGPDVGEAVRVLFETRLEEMARAGRHDTMAALLALTLGPERAARVMRTVHERLASTPGSG